MNENLWELSKTLHGHIVSQILHIVFTAYTCRVWAFKNVLSVHNTVTITKSNYTLLSHLYCNSKIALLNTKWQKNWGNFLEDISKPIILPSLTRYFNIILNSSYSELLKCLLKV